MVFLCIPLRAKIGAQCFQIGLADNGQLSSAIWAAMPAMPRCDFRLPEMPSLALPPNVFVGSGHNHFRAQWSVCFTVPFRRDFRGLRQQIIESDKNLPVTAIWTTPSSVPATDYSLPAMTVTTYPPCPSVIVGRDGIREQVSIFHGVPLRCQNRIDCLQIIDACCEDISGANGAATVFTAVQQRASAVPIPAFPPDSHVRAD